MPLPAVMGDESTMMGQPGMQPGPGTQASNPQGTPGDQRVTPEDQARGAIEQLSKLRQSNTETLEALATQFPSVSKAAKDVLQAFTQALNGLVKEVIKTTQMEAQRGPATVR